MNEEYIVIPLNENSNNNDIGTGLVIARLEGDRCIPVKNDFLIHIPEGFRKIFPNKIVHKFLDVNLQEPNVNFDRRANHPTVSSKYLRRFDDIYEIISIEDGIPFTKGSEIKFQKIPVTKYFMLNSGQFLYGPYGFERKEDINVLRLKSSDGVVNKYISSEIKDYCFKNESDGDERWFFFEYMKLKKEVSDQFNLHDKLDYLFKGFLRQGSGNYSKEGVKKTLAMLDENKIKDKWLAKTRLEDVKSYFSQDDLYEKYNFPSSFDEDLKNIFLKLFGDSTNGSEEIIQKYIEKNKQNLFKNDYAEFSRKEKEINFKISQIQDEKVVLQKELDELRNKPQIVTSVEIDKEIIRQNNIIKELRDEISKNKKEDEEKRQLEEKSQDLDKEIRDKEAVLRRVEQMINEREKEYSDNDTRQIEKIKKLKRDLSYLWTLGGGKNNISESPVFSPTIEIKKYNNKYDFLTEFYKQLEIRYSIKNLVMPDRNCILNRLVSYAQSLLCIYAGKPGTGKTLFSEMFSSVLASENFCFVSVPKGWENNHDFIGYHNPFSSEFQEAQSGFYSFSNKILKNQEVPSVCLLDEANLSQMEYYWSDFIKVTDKLTDKSIIRVGNEEIDVPSNLRFLATINNDETTETLSPRIIDRSPIIVFKDIVDLDMMFEKNDNVDFVPVQFSFKDVIELFGLKNDAALVQKEIEILHRIKEFIPISSRKINAIRNYCHVTRDLFNDSFDDDRKTPQSLIALDYCIKQHILTQISGRGDQYFKKLEEVSSILNEMELFESEKMLNEIIQNGKQYNMYSFFYW